VKECYEAKLPKYTNGGVCQELHKLYQQQF